MERLDTTITVQTPERVGFRYRVAGAAQRGVAWGVDLVVQMVIVAGLILGFTFLASFGDFLEGVGTGGLLFGLFLLTWFYGAAFEVFWSGRTPGKAVVGLRVVKGDGAPVGVRDAVLRNLIRGVDALPFFYVVGALSSLIDGRSRRIGDLVADTIVITERKAELLDDVVIEPPVSEEERRALPVKVTLTRRERRAIEDLLRRRLSFTDDYLEELAGHLAPKLGAREGIEASSSLRLLTLAYARATGKDD